MFVIYEVSMGSDSFFYRETHSLDHQLRLTLLSQVYENGLILNSIEFQEKLLEESLSMLNYLKISDENHSDKRRTVGILEQVGQAVEIAKSEGAQIIIS